MQKPQIVNQVSIDACFQFKLIFMYTKKNATKMNFEVCLSYTECLYDQSLNACLQQNDSRILESLMHRVAHSFRKI